MISKHSHKFVMNWTHPLRFCLKLSEGGHFAEDFPITKLGGIFHCKPPHGFRVGSFDNPKCPTHSIHCILWSFLSHTFTKNNCRFSLWESLVTNGIWKRKQYVIYKMDDHIQLKHLDAKIWKRCSSSLVLLCLLHHDFFPQMQPLFAMKPVNSHRFWSSIPFTIL